MERPQLLTHPPTRRATIVNSIQHHFGPSIMQTLRPISVRCVAVACLFFATVPCPGQDSDLPWLAGFAKVDVTPTEPVRMAGYGSRDHPSEGIDTPLYVRCVALQSPSGDQPASLLLSVDTIGLPGSMTRDLAQAIEQQHGTPREKIVFCCTHTHCGPDLISELSNIFKRELGDDEIAAGRRYKSQLRQGILDAVTKSLEDLAPARLAYAVGSCGFAANRRVLTDGRWSGFGVQPDGPVDHTVPVLRITGSDGIVRGMLYNYACHCTTLGGSHYQINAEWAGYCSTALESKYSDSVALCTIGCGADANPEPRGTLDATKVHGRTLAAEVTRIIGGEMKTVDSPLIQRIDYAGLSFELPTPEELAQRISSDNPQARRHAQQLLETYEREGRLPATYPVPIQAWQFGDQLTMIFLGGEVVVDYALRLKKTLDDPDLWVTAYANDVLGYICSERMRSEGGYEYDRSGVYYGLPGPWAAGTEDFLIRRVKELVDSRGKSKPLPPDQALRSFQVHDSAKIELVAAEPLVQDPINIAFGTDGALWVVEMGDYPEGKRGGNVKILTDTDGDGTFDSATLFLSQLSFPTGVQPWRDGALIASAPNILWARDTDGDRRADHVEKLYTGFRLANPQHRISGFSYGLDHSLHCSSGDNLAEITSTKTGQTINASGRDVKIWPDDGSFVTVSGRTQYIRSRNDWGQWFGNDNSRPMYHFPIDDAYLARNPAVSYPANTHQLFSPAVAPPVFPLTSVTERFNDLFAAGRFTSACSAIVFRASSFKKPDQEIAFICEPVHNLVHRTILEKDGATFRAVRSEQEQQAEFLASTDPWFRPTRAITGPDGALWIVDMYRETIEHPQWIPQAWQQQLDLRAGHDRGRIYRISAADKQDRHWKSVKDDSTKQLVGRLQSDSGMLRDMAQRLLIERSDDAAVPLLQELAIDASQPRARVHALSILAVLGKLNPETLQSALQDDHPGVLNVAITLCQSRIDDDPQILQALKRLAEHPDPAVALQVAVAAGETNDSAAAGILATVATRPDVDRWIARAVVSSASKHATPVATALVGQLRSGRRWPGGIAEDLLSQLLETAAAAKVNVLQEFGDLLADDHVDTKSRLHLASVLARTSKSRKIPPQQISRQFGSVYDLAVEMAKDSECSEEQRCSALKLVGLGIGSVAVERELLVSLLSPDTPPKVQQQAIDRLTETDTSAAADVLLQRWPSMSNSVRDHCANRLLTRRPWTESLLSALESGQVGVADLSAAVRQQLVKSGSRSMRVRAQRLVNISSSAQKHKIIQTYLARYSHQRDTSDGAVLFKKHCAVCHLTDPQGRAIGASLANLSNRSDRALTEAVLDPNRAVDPKYQSYLIETDDGRILSGAIEEEAGSSITLAHADGKRTVIRRGEIVSMKNSGVSLMPEGFEEILPPSALANVIQYIQENATGNETQP